MRVISKCLDRLNNSPLRTVRTSRYRLRRALRSMRLESVSDRQERIAGFDQALLSSAHVAVIGAGMGGEIAEGLVRKGVGALTIVDFDEVSWTNLNRQFFFPRQVGRMKAHCLARNLARHATCGTTLRSIALSFEQAIDTQTLGLEDVDVLVVVVDNTAARVAAATAALHTCPVVFSAMDFAGEAVYVAVQEPSKPCFACVVPQALTPRKTPCAAPAVKDTSKLAAGAVLFAIDTLLMPERKRQWNYHELRLAGVMPSWTKTFPRQDDCPICRQSGMPSPL